jgi:hypothetical protein
MEGVATDPRSERMNKLVAAFDKAMTKTLNGCTQKLFLESYPAQLTAEHKDIFIAAHERFLPVLHTNIKVRLNQALLNSHLLKASPLSLHFCVGRGIGSERSIPSRCQAATHRSMEGKSAGP